MQTVSNPSSTLKNAHPTDKGAAEQQRLLSINDDELFSDLFQKGYIDKTGLCLNTMPPFPEIGIAVEKKILQLFKCPLKKEFKITHGELVTIEFTLQELFQYLLCTQNNVKIEEIEIFGSTVPWLLQEGDFLDRVFQSLKTSKQSVDSFTNLPSDLDLRVRIPSADVAVITAFRKNTVTFFCDKIGSILGKSGRSLNTNDRNVVIQWGFSKYTTPKEQRISSVIGLGGLCSDAFFKDFDILFEKGNGRKCMMSLDALRIPVMRLVRGEPRQPIYPVTEFSTGPWQPIIDRLRRVVRAEALETLDPIAIKRAFSDSLLGYVSVTKDLESTLLHKIVKAIENEEPHLLQQLSNEVKNAELRDKIAFVLSDWLKGAAGSHFNHNTHARVLIALRNFTAITKAQLPEAAYLIQEIWKGMAFAQPQEASLLETHALAPLDTGLHPLLLAMKTCLNKNLSLLDPIQALLEVKTFLLACNYSSNIGPRLSLSCLHGCLDLKIDGLHYFLPLDPVDALTRLFKNITPENESLFLSIDRALPRLASFDRHQTPLIKKTLNESQLKAIRESLTKYLNDAIQKEIHPLCLRICLEAFFAINNLGMEVISFNRVEAFIPKMTAQLETVEERQLFLDDIRTCKLKLQEISALDFMQKTLKSQPTSTALSWAQALLQTGDEARISAALQLCKAEIKPESCWSEPLSDILERVSVYRLDLFAKLLLEWAQGNVQPEIILRSLSFAEKPLIDNRIKIDKAKVLLHLVQTLNFLAAKRQADAEFISAFNCIISAAFSHNVSMEEILKTCSHVDSNWSEYGEQKAAWVAQLLERSQWQQAYKLWEKLFSSAEEPGALDSLQQLLTALTSQPAKSHSTELLRLSLTVCKHVFFNQLFQERKTAALQLLEKSISLAMGWKKDNLIPDLMQMMKSCSNKQILGYISFYLTSKGDSLKPDIQEWILTNWQLLTDSLVVESPSLCLAFLSNCSTTHKLKWIPASSLAILAALLDSSLTPKDKIKANTLFNEAKTQIKGKTDPKVESIIQSLLKEKLYTEAKEWLDIYESSDGFVHTFQKAIQEAEESKMEQVFDFVKELTLTDEAISQLIAEAFSTKFNLSSYQGKQLTITLRVPCPEKKFPVRIAWIKALTFSSIQEKCESAYRLSCGLIQEQKSKTEADPLLKELLLEQLTAFQTTFPNLAAKLLIEAYPKYIDFATTAKIMIQLTAEEECFALFKTLAMRFLELKEVKAPTGFATLLYALICSEKNHQLLFKLQGLANAHFLSESDWQLCQGYYANWMERFNLNTELAEAGALWSLWSKQEANQKLLSESLERLFDFLCTNDKINQRELLQAYLLLLQTDQGICYLEKKEQLALLLVERSLHLKKPLIDELLALLQQTLIANKAAKFGILAFIKIFEREKNPQIQLRTWFANSWKIINTAVQQHVPGETLSFLKINANFQCNENLTSELETFLPNIYNVVSNLNQEECRKEHSTTSMIRSLLQNKIPNEKEEHTIFAFYSLYVKYQLYKEAQEWAILLKSQDPICKVVELSMRLIESDENAERLLYSYPAHEGVQKLFARLYSDLLFERNLDPVIVCRLLKVIKTFPEYFNYLATHLKTTPSTSLSKLMHLSIHPDREMRSILFALAADLFSLVEGAPLEYWIFCIPDLKEVSGGIVKKAFENTFSDFLELIAQKNSHSSFFILMKMRAQLDIDSPLQLFQARRCSKLAYELIINNLNSHSTEEANFFNELCTLIQSKSFSSSIRADLPEQQWQIYFAAVPYSMNKHLYEKTKLLISHLVAIYKQSESKNWLQDNFFYVKNLQTWMIRCMEKAPEIYLTIKNELEMGEDADVIKAKEDFKAPKDYLMLLATIAENPSFYKAVIPKKEFLTVIDHIVEELSRQSEIKNNHLEAVLSIFENIIVPLKVWQSVLELLKRKDTGLLLEYWEAYKKNKDNYSAEFDSYMDGCSQVIALTKTQFNAAIFCSIIEFLIPLINSHPDSFSACKTGRSFLELLAKVTVYFQINPKYYLELKTMKEIIQKRFNDTYTPIIWLVITSHCTVKGEFDNAYKDYEQFLRSHYPKNTKKKFHSQDDLETTYTEFTTLIAFIKPQLRDLVINKLMKFITVHISEVFEFETKATEIFFQHLLTLKGPTSNESIFPVSKMIEIMDLFMIDKEPLKNIPIALFSIILYHYRKLVDADKNVEPPTVSPNENMICPFSFLNAYPDFDLFLRKYADFQINPKTWDTELGLKRNYDFIDCIQDIYMYTNPEKKHAPDDNPLRFTFTFFCYLAKKREENPALLPLEVELEQFKIIDRLLLNLFVYRKETLTQSDQELLLSLMDQLIYSPFSQNKELINQEHTRRQLIINLILNTKISFNQTRLIQYMLFFYIQPQELNMRFHISDFYQAAGELAQRLFNNQNPIQLIKGLNILLQDINFRRDESKMIWGLTESIVTETLANSFLDTYNRCLRILIEKIPTQPAAMKELDGEAFQSLMKSLLYQYNFQDILMMASEDIRKDFSSIIKTSLSLFPLCPKPWLEYASYAFCSACALDLITPQELTSLLDELELLAPKAEELGVSKLFQKTREKIQLGLGILFQETPNQALTNVGGSVNAADLSE